MRLHDGAHRHCDIRQQDLHVARNCHFLKKSVTHIITYSVWIIVGLYACLAVAFRVPAVQERIAQEATGVLEEKLGTKVMIERIIPTFFNRLTIDGFVLYDQDSKVMLRSSRLSAGIDVMDLFKGKITVSSAQLFGLEANITKKGERSPYNFQFVIDSLSSEDTTQTRLDLHISSLVIRNGVLNYDELYKPYERGVFSPSHMSITNISSHIIIYSLTNDALRASINNLAFKEKSGINVRKLSLTTNVSRHNVAINDLHLQMAHSSILVPELSATYGRKANGDINLKSVKVNGYVNAQSISPLDVQPFLKYDVSSMPNVAMIAKISGNSEKTDASVHLNTSDNTLSISTAFALQNIFNDSIKDAFSRTVYDVKEIKVRADQSLIAKMSSLADLPELLHNIGDVDIEGKAKGTRDNFRYALNVVTSNTGEIDCNGHYANKSLELNAMAKQLQINKLTGNEDVKALTADAVVKTDFQRTELDCKVSELEYKGYKYGNLNLSGMIVQKGSDMDGDLCLVADDANLKGTVNNKIHVTNKHIDEMAVNASIEHIVPQKLSLTDVWDNASFAFNVDANLKGQAIDDIVGYADVTDFTINGAHKSLKEEYGSTKATVGNLTFNTVVADDGLRHTTLSSDFCRGKIDGTYQFSTILDSFGQIFKTYLPSLTTADYSGKTSNKMSFSLNVSSCDFIRRMTGMDIKGVENIELYGYLDDGTGTVNVYTTMPRLVLNDTEVADLKLLLWTTDSKDDNEDWKTSLNTTLSAIVSPNDDSKLQIDLSGYAVDDVLTSTLTWEEQKGGTFKGTLNTLASGYRDNDGNNSFNIKLTPSDILLGDTVWHLHSNDINYGNDRIEVNSFAIENERQHIYVNGVASDSPADSLIADLKDVNVEYIMNLVDFHSVDFGGLASGRAVGKAVLGTPEAYAHLDVKHFLFEKGDLGTLSVAARYNNVEEQVDINGVTSTDTGKLLINGFVAPQRDAIRLELGCRNTNLTFLRTFTESFMSDIDITATGDMLLGGNISRVMLTGDVFAKGTFSVSSLNCDYIFPGDSIHLINDNILLQNQPILDKQGGKATVTGGLHHQSFTRMSYDLDIDAEHLLAYDFHEFGDDVFYGTAYLTGNCKLDGYSSEFNINVNGKADDGSIIVYNSSSPETIANQEFITWSSSNAPKSEQVKDVPDDEEEYDDISTNIHMNFLFSVDEGSTLRVLMDERSGDYIDLHGTGDLRATYYNKGSFDLFGNYNINSGLYHLTIQNVLRRDFEFLSGSSMKFNGDPLEARLDLKSQYVLNSVPLADLNIGQSFSNNNVRVTCLMDIGGTAGEPSVTFNMDLPTVNSEAKQMINSLINSEEEMNQQVLYLLSVGRFYAQGANNESQQDNLNSNRTNQMMQSVLSGTLSQQMGNLLNGILKNNNWTLGANIAPGDEGFTNAEYEGIFSGSLLNNRLLVNGQVGYRDNATTSNQEFIGDFDIRYLLVPRGNFALRFYNQTNDRYFTRNSMNTQGVGLVWKTEFNSWKDLFFKKKTQK